MSTTDHTNLRIIDANLNRAREALRVLEEYARFGLDDAGLSSTVKNMRHDLAKCIPEAFANALLAHRDIVGDVGRDVGTATEYERADASHVAEAAGKRLSEALRAIEEYAKIIDPAFAAAVEKIRYRGYDLERRLTVTTRARERFGHVRLYVLLTESLCHGDWFATAEAALKGGADCLQLREKGLTDRELLERARRLIGLCRDHGALLIVNDRPDIAVLSGADGVHLGQDDVTVAEARRIVPSAAVVGVSTHTMEQLIAATAAAPDYVAVGPMFSTATKPQDHIAGPETLTAARKHTSLPLVAIGGIKEQNAGEVLSAASCCLCVCGAVIAQPDVAAATARLRALIDQSVAA